MLNVTNTNFYRYTISRFDILIPGKEPIQLDKSRVTGMFIEKDFDTDIFPVLSVKLLLNFIDYYNIIDNKSTVKFKMKLERYLYDKNNPTDQIRYNEVIFDSLFSSYIDVDTSFLNKDLYKQYKEALLTTENSSLQEHEFFLFKESDIESATKIINRVIKQGTMTDVVTYLLSTSGVNKVIMSPIENKTVYDEILLPPIPVWKSISYLEEQYGFYKYGMTHFFDFDKMYFIDKGPECTAYQLGEITDVVVPILKATNNSALLPGSFKDVDNNLYLLNVFTKNVNMYTKAIQEDVLSSTNITVIDAKDGSTDKISPNVESRIGRTRHIINNFNNKFINSMIEHSKNENAHIIQITLNDIDIDCLSPNKRFKFLFEDKELNTTHGGYYRLTSEMCVFTLLSEGDFSVSSIAEFKKS